MREILFRGKRIDNGEWVYGHYGEYTNMRSETISAMESWNRRVKDVKERNDKSTD